MKPNSLLKKTDSLVWHYAKNVVSFLLIQSLVLGSLRAIEIVSIGGACNVARAARHNDMRNTAYPFDWLITPLGALKEAFRDDFSQVLNQKKLHEREDKKAVVDGYGFVYIHDFPTVRYPETPIDGEIMPVHELLPEWRDALPIVQDKFKRRLQRLLRLLQEGVPAALVRYNEMDRKEAEGFVELLKQKFPKARVILVVLGCTPDFKESWNLPHVRNFYIDEDELKAWDGEAWSAIIREIYSLDPQGWSTPVIAQSFRLTSPLYNPGFFCVFHTVLGALDCYDRGEISGLSIDFEQQGWYYDAEHGPNWWSYFFEPVKLGIIPDETEEKLFPTYQKIEFGYYAQFEMSRETACRLIDKYIQVRPEIMDQVEQFHQTNFADYFVIGVHYRGTDKSEVSPITYSDVTYHIDSIRAAHIGESIKIFVATDDAFFASYMVEKYAGLVIMRDVFRSEDTTGLHMCHKLSPYTKGEDALLDCILLSQCSVLIKTASNLSDCSLKFNPHLPAIVLNASFCE